MKPIIVYMVAGLSSRFNGKIKQFAKVTNKETLIEYSINQALPYISKIIFVVGEKTREPFKKKFKRNFKGIPIFYTYQSYDKKTRDKPWGTLDALCTTIPFLDRPAIICNGDDLYGKQSFKKLALHLKKNKTDATIGYKLWTVIPEQGKVTRGIFKLENNKVGDIKEQFNLSKDSLKTQTLKDQYASMNLFLLTPKTIKKLHVLLTRFKEKHKDDKAAECLLPQELAKLIQINELSLSFYPATAPWFGITNPGDETTIREALGKISKPSRGFYIPH